MVHLRRLIALTLAILAAVTLGVGIATAQDRPNVPPPSDSPRLNLDDYGDDGNAFQQGFEECKNEDLSLTEKLTDPSTYAGLAFGGLGGFTTGLFNDNVRCSASNMLQHPLAGLGTAWSNTASAFWGDPVGKFTKAVIEGNTSAFATVMTFWMSVPIPSLTGGAAITGIRNITFEIQLVALAIGIAYAGIKLAVARKQAVAEGADETAKMLTRTIFSIWTAPVLVITLHQLGDSFSTWVIDTASGGDLGGKITAISWIDEQTGLGPVVSLVLAGIGLLGSVVQLVALLIREAVLALVVALSPIAAASSATGTGRQTWSSMIAFTIAALLFKPVASLLYAFAFWAASSDTAADAVIGAVLLAVAGLALPSLMRVISPAVSTISAGGGQVAAMAGATGAIAGGGAAMMSKAGGSGGVAGSGGGGGGQGGGGGGGGQGAPASGAKNGSAYGGRYSGGGGGGAAAGGAKSAGMGKAAVAAGGVATGVGAVVAGTAKAMQSAGRGLQQASSFAEGAIGNYHGQVPR